MCVVSGRVGSGRVGSGVTMICLKVFLYVNVCSVCDNNVFQSVFVYVWCVFVYLSVLTLSKMEG